MNIQIGMEERFLNIG